MSDEFHFVGGHVALDFINTVVRGTEGPEDLLVADGAAWHRWIAAAGLPVPKSGSGVDSLSEILQLREAIRRALRAWHLGKDPTAQDLATINGHLGRPRPAPSLTWHGGEPRRPLSPELHSTLDVLSWIADQAASLMLTGDRERFKGCRGSECLLSFIDTSRNGSRRWCSMSTCGNRSKAARHYRRSRNGG